METQIFDALYRLLAGAIGVALVAAIVTARQRAMTARGHADVAAIHALGGAAAGVLVSLIVGFGLNLARSVTGDVIYQTVHFGVFYIGFWLVLRASFALLDPTQRASDPSAGERLAATRLRVAAIVAFAGLVVVAVGIMAAAAASSLSGDGRMRQEVVYFAPVVAALGFACAAAGAAARSATGWRRAAARRYALFVALLFVGFLREANVIPSTGSPLVDLLLAFGPFLAGSLCLLAAARSARS